MPTQRFDLASLNDPIIEVERMERPRDELTTTQRALDWAMRFYPFSEHLPAPSPEIQHELNLSLERNKSRFIPGWRR